MLTQSGQDRPKSLGVLVYQLLHLLDFCGIVNA
jgi:hypothetical protein